MRVLIAPDCFTGTLTAIEAAEAVARGWASRSPSDELDLCPLADGGPGFLDVLHRALGGRLLPVTVPGPWGTPTQAAVLLIPDEAGSLTGYIESAQASGLHLVPHGSRDPGRTTSAGVGVLLRSARAAGARRIVVGLGGSGVNDAGAGLLAALRDGARDRLGGGGAGLRGITAGDVDAAGLVPLATVLDEWAEIEIVVASDVDVPLLGIYGASIGFAEQKGATPEQAQELDRALTDFATAVIGATGAPDKLVAQAGAGAAGGLGFALLLLGGRRMPGAQAVIDAVGLADRIRRSDVVVTGEGCFDWQSLRGKVVTGVAREALAVGVPVVVIAGQVLVGRRESVAIGIESTYAVARTPDEVTAALADPRGTLEARAERVARTWSH